MAGTMQHVEFSFDEEAKALLEGMAERPGPVLQMEKGDLLVFSYPGILPQEARDRVKAEIHDRFGIEAIVLDGGLMVEALIKKDARADNEPKSTTATPE